MGDPVEGLEPIFSWIPLLAEAAQVICEQYLWGQDCIVSKPSMKSGHPKLTQIEAVHLLVYMLRKCPLEEELGYYRLANCYTIQEIYLDRHPRNPICTKVLFCLLNRS